MTKSWMDGKKTPCFECEARCQGCHDTCDKYKKYREKIDKLHDERAREHQKDNDIYMVRYKGTAWNK